MFRNVLNALNEALDITLHLHPLIDHFKVVKLFWSGGLLINAFINAGY